MVDIFHLPEIPLPGNTLLKILAWHSYLAQTKFAMLRTVSSMYGINSASLFLLTFNNKNKEK